MAKPAKPTVPLPPLRSNPDTFSARMEASLLFWKTFADYLDELGTFSEAQADAALAAALAAGSGTGLALKGNGGKVMAVNAGATALEFLPASSAGKSMLAKASAAGVTLASGADAAAQRATLGLGAVTAVAELVTNLNDITVSGWSRFTPAAENSPFGNRHGSVLTIVFDSNANSAVQLVWGHNANASDTLQQIRWRAAGTWSAWVRLYSSESEIRAFALGEGQTWQNLSPSRAAATTYQNTTGRPIGICITLQGNAHQVQVSGDNVAWLTLGAGAENALDRNTVSAIVPNGAYYRVTGGAVIFWAELR